MQGIEEAGAGGVQVKAEGVVGQAQGGLHGTGRAGDDSVRGHGGDNAHPDVPRREPGAVQSRPGRAGTETAVGLRSENTPLPDAGAVGNPLVAGVHLPGQIVVGEDPAGQTAPGTPNFYPVHGFSFRGAAVPICLNF